MKEGGGGIKRKINDNNDSLFLYVAKIGTSTVYTCSVRKILIIVPRGAVKEPGHSFCIQKKKISSRWRRSPEEKSRRSGADAEQSGAERGRDDVRSESVKIRERSPPHRLNTLTPSYHLSLSLSLVLLFTHSLSLSRSLHLLFLFLSLFLYRYRSSTKTTVECGGTVTAPPA